MDLLVRTQLAEDRSEAVLVGQRLLGAQYIQSCPGRMQGLRRKVTAKPFLDSAQAYVFTRDLSAAVKASSSNKHFTAERVAKVAARSAREPTPLQLSAISQQMQVRCCCHAF